MLYKYKHNKHIVIIVMLLVYVSTCGFASDSMAKSSDTASRSSNIDTSKKPKKPKKLKKTKMTEKAENDDVTTRPITIKDAAQSVAAGAILSVGDSIINNQSRRNNNNPPKVIIKEDTKVEGVSNDRSQYRRRLVD